MQLVHIFVEFSTVSPFNLSCFCAMSYVNSVLIYFLSFFFFPFLSFVLEITLLGHNLLLKAVNKDTQAEFIVKHSFQPHSLTWSLPAFLHLATHLGMVLRTMGWETSIINQDSLIQMCFQANMI